MKVNLPKGTTDQIKREQTRTLSVDRRGKIYLNDVAISPEQLHADLARLSKSDPPITILVKADEANNYGAVMEVLKELHAAKVAFALMTQEETAPKLSPEMSTIEKRFRRNFVVACLVHAALIGGIIFFEGTINRARSNAPIVTELITPADIRGDQPTGSGNGRGQYTAPPPEPAHQPERPPAAHRKRLVASAPTAPPVAPKVKAAPPETSGQTKLRSRRSKRPSNRRNRQMRRRRKRELATRRRKSRLRRTKPVTTAKMANQC